MGTMWAPVCTICVGHVCHVCHACHVQPVPVLLYAWSAPNWAAGGWHYSPANMLALQPCEHAGITALRTCWNMVLRCWNMVLRCWNMVLRWALLQHAHARVTHDTHRAVFSPPPWWNALCLPPVGKAASPSGSSRRQHWGHWGCHSGPA